MCSAWIARRPPKPRACLRLFCLPYAGGAASIYQRWHERLSDSVDVCPIELPGRLSRLREAPFREVKPLVAALSSMLAPCFDMPFALFGYSMGALLAYEWARLLAREHGLEARHLIVAARQAPDQVSNVHMGRSLPDFEFLARIKNLYGSRLDPVLCDPDMRAIFVAMLRADLGMLDAYVHESGAALNTPITVLGGDGDASVGRQSLAGWQQHTRSGFALRMVAGDHFFIHTHEGAVIDTVKAALGLSEPTPIAPLKTGGSRPL